MTVLARARVILTADDVQLTRALRGSAAAMEQAGRKMTRIGRQLSLGVTAPLVAIGGAATKMGADFEAEMQKIVGLVGVAQDQVDGWGKEILDLAPQLGAAPRELAEGLFFVTSAGFRGAEAMEVLEQAGRASAAGLGEIATVADAVTSAVNAYGQENLAASDATDILTAAVREGKLEAESLTPVLGNLLPTASAMGISFDQVAGTLAVFSRTGADATSGATSLRAIMSTLQKPTEQASKALSSAGLSMGQLRDRASEPGGLIEVMRLLEDAFGDNEEALAQVFPNVRAFRGVMNALAQDAATVDAVMGGVTNSTGAADHAFETAADTAKFRLRQSLREAQVVMVRFGEQVTPIVVRAFEGLTRVLRTVSDTFAGMPRPLQVASIRLAGFAVAAGPVLWAAGQLTIAVSALAKAFVAMKLTGVVTGFVGWGKAVLGLIPAVKSLSGALALLQVAAGPTGWLVLGIGAIVGVTTVWIRRMREAARETREARERIDELRQSAAGWTQATREAEAVRIGTQLAEAQNRLKAMREEAEGLRSSLQGAAPSERLEARGRLQELDPAIEEEARVVRQLRGEYEALAQTVMEAGQASGQAAGPTGDLENGLSGLMEGLQGGAGMTDDVQEAIAQLNTDLGAAARQSELLGSEFNRSDAEATAYAAAIEALASTSADLDTPIGKNGESLRDLAETYLALEAEATKSAEAERAARQEREAITAATEGLTDRLRENVQLQALLGGEFDKASADASAYGSAVRALTAAGVDMDAVVTANGETLRDLADRYVELTAAAGPANAMQAEGERLTRQFLTPAEELAMTQARYNELLDAGAISQETFNRAMAEADMRFREATESLGTLEDGLVRTAAMGIDAFAAFATGAGDAMSRFVKRALSDLARLIARVLVARALLAAFPGSGFVASLAGAIAPRGLASGGRFRKDETLLVGEEGPELITPNFSGQVFSAPDTSRMMASAGSASVAHPGTSAGAARSLAGAGGGTLSLDTGSLPPPPRTVTPDAVATDDWWRRAFGHLKLDYDERGGT